MKFTTGLKCNTIVWDKENNTRLCRFVGGVFETDDKRTIDLLKKAGYRSDESGQAEQGNPEGQAAETEQEEKANLKEMTYAEMKVEAKRRGIPVGKKSKVELMKALKEGE